MFFSHLKRGFNLFLAPIIDHFIRRGYSPDMFTVLGLVFNAIAAVFYAYGKFFEAGIIMAFGSTTDLIDGQLARTRGIVSTAGALLDSTLDRYSETFVLSGLIIHYALLGWEATVFAAALAISGSMMVSYIRARAEALGYDCHVGFMQRPERVIFLAAASVFGPFLNSPNATVAAALWVLAAGTHFTAFERMIYVRKQAKAFDRRKAEEHHGASAEAPNEPVARPRESSGSAVG